MNANLLALARHFSEEQVLPPQIQGVLVSVISLLSGEWVIPAKGPIEFAKEKILPAILNANANPSSRKNAKELGAILQEDRVSEKLLHLLLC